MYGSDSLIDPTTSSAVAGASFQLVRRGYDPMEVQAFARAVSSELQRLSVENQELRAKVRTGENLGDLDDTSIAQFLGSETTRLLEAARETAGGIIRRAEERAAELIALAEEDGQQIRENAVDEVSHERRAAEDEARRLIAEANEQRRMALGEFARRRDLASTQLRELLRGRDVLVQALANVASSSNAMLQRLESITTIPDDFVNLDPTADDDDPGMDVGAVLRVEFAPPAPGSVRVTRPGPPATTVADLGRLPDDGDTPVYVLEG